ncbi:B-box domain protein 31 [Camellia lanceoleosa]|uniref:B-box domain protein 31 n=1 Tax=Camellia lanceoleosa TaxID=1840588 RepID=A0ACC0HC62_9ERIC|nr:B-box domain protein 31 [Camellia lanceoleosa]
MCRGIDRELNHINGSSEIFTDVVSFHGIIEQLDCELCGSRASLYCQADDAFLCRRCDKRVHGANFLAFRHIRCLLCDTCQNLTERYVVRNSEMALPVILNSRQCVGFVLIS